IELPEKPKWLMANFKREIEARKPCLEMCGLLEANGTAKKFGIVNPGATWFTKRYPPEKFGEVAKGLIEQHDLPVVVTWAGDEELKAGQTIVEIAGGKGKRAFLAPKTNLRELAALTQQSVL